MREIDEKYPQLYGLLKKNNRKTRELNSNFSELEHEKYESANANPRRPDPGRIEKINLNFYFHTSFSKRPP